jgi:hypothetical protein
MYIQKKDNLAFRSGKKQKQKKGRAKRFGVERTGKFSVYHCGCIAPLFLKIGVLKDSLYFLKGKRKERCKAVPVFFSCISIGLSIKPLQLGLSSNRRFLPKKKLKIHSGKTGKNSIK